MTVPALNRVPARPFRAIVFDWDGTAVVNRQADATALGRVVDALLAREVWIVVVTGTHVQHVERQLLPSVAHAHRAHLLLCTNRGSEVFGFDAEGLMIRRWLREATAEEDQALTATAEAVRGALMQRTHLEIRIVYDRLNRRKIDLIPTREWADPPKERIGALLGDVEARLRGAGVAGGLADVVAMTARIAQEHGLTDARITSDVKHVEVGLTDKGDSMGWLAAHLIDQEGIGWHQVLVAGDEFGPIAGFPGSDDLLRRGAPGATIVSVGREPNGVPAGVIHLGGGPESFHTLLTEQLRLQQQPEPPIRPDATWHSEVLRPTSDESWTLREERYVDALEHEVESRFTVSNGALGTRGSLEHPTGVSRPRAFLAGFFHQTDGAAVPGMAWGPDWVRFQLRLNGDPTEMNQSEVLSHSRTLDMRRGLLLSTWEHATRLGGHVTVRTLRFASLAQRSLSLQIVEVGVDMPTPVVLDFRDGNDVASLQLVRREPGLELWGTALSPRRLAVAMRARAELQETVPWTTAAPDDESWSGTLIPGEPRYWVRLMAYAHDSSDAAVSQQALKSLQYAQRRGTLGIVQAHQDAWAERWAHGDVEVAGDPSIQRALRFAIYHLIGAANPENERVSIGARALTGEAYMGHVFWDTEIFLLPFYTHTWPAAARALLMYRYHTLAGARGKAARLGYQGALYAWESTDTGEETTPPFAIGPQGEIIPILAGTHQHHISADIAYAVWQYWQSTGDDDFMLHAGAEIILETARFWASRVSLGSDERYHILDIVGPDEYHEHVDDNAYTNVLAAWNLEHGTKVAALLRECWPDRWQAVAASLSLAPTEPAEWRRIADGMYTGFHPETGLFEQFRGYFDLEEVDLASYEPRTVPMDVLLGRERTQRSKVTKQADVLLMLALLWDRYPREVHEANFRYYEPRCGHGSSLSPAIHALIAARLEKLELAMGYVAQTAAIDLDDTMGNASGGVHIAAQGGLWQAITLGFAGIETGEDGVHLAPILPPTWRHLAFRIQWRQRQLHLKFNPAHRSTSVTLERGDPMTVWVGSRATLIRPLTPAVIEWAGTAFEGSGARS